MNPRPILLALLLGPALLRAADAPAQPTVIVSDTLESQSSDVQTISDFDGHVHVDGTNIKIDCDHLHVISSRVGDQGATIGQPTGVKYMLATGHVHIVQVNGVREATCGRAELLPEQNKIVLTENPVVTDRGDGSTMAGERMEMLRDQRKVHVFHPHIVAPPMKDLGFDKNQPPPGAAATPAAPAK